MKRYFLVHAISLSSITQQFLNGLFSYEKEIPLRVDNEKSIFSRSAG